MISTKERGFLRHQIELACGGTPLQPLRDFAGAHLTPVVEKAILESTPLTSEMIEVACQGTPLEELAEFAGPYLQATLATYLKNWHFVCQTLAKEDK